jgi:hypothetical protein
MGAAPAFQTSEEATMVFEAMDNFFKTATEADFDRLKAGVLKSLEPAECLVVLPGCDVAPVSLQEDPHLTSKAMFIIAKEMTGLTEENWLDVSDEIRANSIRAATRVLTLIDDLQGQRVYSVTMPKSADDAATLRAMFAEPDSGLGPQLRDLDDETGVFDVLNEHYRKQRI